MAVVKSCSEAPLGLPWLRFHRHPLSAFPVFAFASSVCILCGSEILMCAGIAL